MNNLFDDPNAREKQVDQQQSSSTPRRGTARRSSNSDHETAPEPRGPSIINFFKGHKGHNSECVYLPPLQPASLMPCLALQSCMLPPS